MNWFVTGVNYKKASLHERQLFSLNEEQISSAYEKFVEAGVDNALIISTCNRTEFFLPEDQKERAINTLFNRIYQLDLNSDLFHIKEGDEALEYFFRICSGLESQIAGDFEILGQVRKSCMLAKSKDMIPGIWEKAINNALKAAKRARTETGFYSGASSTSYAAIEYLRKAGLNFRKSRFLIVGSGKIGAHTLDHLIKHADASQVALSNRSFENAAPLLEKRKVEFLPFAELKTGCKSFDVIICATNAPDYIISPEMVRGGSARYFIDLSVPLNIDPSIGDAHGVKLVNVDELSILVNENLKKRSAEVSKVEEIIHAEINELQAWYTIKNGMPLLSELKGELEQLKSEALSKLDNKNDKGSSEFLDQYTDELFDQLSQGWIKKVRNQSINAEA